VKTSVLGTAWAVCKIGTMLMKARLGGGYRENPFFRPGTSEPVKPPQVLSLEERKALTP
jgi:hypothetical protein